MALQDSLVNLCLEVLEVIDRDVERSQQRRGTLQVALCLLDSRLLHQDILVVWRNIENFIKLSQRFRKTTKTNIGDRMLREEINIARVEPLGFFEISFAPVPLASSPCDIS